MAIFKRIWGLCRPHKRYFIFGLTTLIIANLTRLVFPKINGILVDEVVYNGRLELLLPICAALAGFTLLRSACNYSRGLAFERLSQNFVFDMRTTLYDHLQSMPYGFYDSHYIGEIMSRMTGDIEGLRNLLAGGIVQFAENLIWFAGSMTLMFFISWRLALLMVFIAPVVAIIAVIFRRRIHPAFRNLREQNAVLSTKTQENLSGARVVKAFAREEYEKEAFKKENQERLRLSLVTTFIWSDFVPVLDILGGLCTPLLLGAGGLMVMNGSLSLGDLITFTGYIWMITGPMRSMGMLVNMFTNAHSSAEKLFHYADLGATIKDRPKTVFPDPFMGHVVFDDVTFGYGDRAVLQNISMDVPAGSSCAIMGETGSGKSSVVNLIARFYECRGGQVKIDGVDVKDMPLLKLRARVGYIMQETFLFSESIENNIRFGGPEDEMDRVQRAAKAAQAEEFIEEMQQRYDTVVGERGMGLSGGQKQRVAIARAIEYDPAILILDDSTSAVDMETEHEIQSALKDVMKNRTTFIIAHRISSVKNADQILILQDGRIAERGDHKSLMELGGLYAAMVRDQYRDAESLGKEAV
ncbi:MAG: ABC transporter ATP-binding protein/permease [Christensenellaceae bacterium]|jgi:ATP-binding cassette subfamily B protein|nr:ABC transporter ATP-binding protein/permease [Christensenellaceae bacterium]